MKTILLHPDAAIHYNWCGKFESPSPEWMHLTRDLIDFEFIAVTQGVLYIADSHKEYVVKKGEYILNHLTPETEYLKRYATLWTYFYKLYKEDPIKNDKLFFNAPAVIIVASNNELNGALAASKMDLMVDALGLGTFYSGFLQIATNDNNEILDFLHISDNKKIVACMVVGYPNVKYKRTVPRKAADIKWI